MSEQRRLNAEEASRIIEARRVIAEFTDAQHTPKVLEPDNVAKRDTRKPWERSLRKVRIWDKDIPISEKGLLTAFRTSEKCGVEEDGVKCPLLLLATRVVNFKPDWDDNHAGMQLKHDFSDVRFYVFCSNPRHGPSPMIGPDHWPSETK